MIDPSEEVRYREEVHHPALAEPETAVGVMRIGPDGGLVREQLRPRYELSEIGEDFISVRSGREGQPNLLPIPDEARPMLDALRALMSGRTGHLLDRFAPKLQEIAPLWSLRLSSAIPGAEIVLSGCGPDLRRIEVQETSGIRRVILFGGRA